jgi:chitodextrinase
MRDYTRGYQTAWANLGNGQPATLFSHYDQQTVDTHFRWMQQYGCDTAALQRFNPFGGEGPTRDAMAAKVRQAAEAFGRKFYIMYDVTNWTNMQSDIKTDWSTKMASHTASVAYARQNGKPVVCIWGFGFSDSARPFSPASCLDVVNWFKGQGCYVIGGVPTYWRQGINDSRAGFGEVYHAFHMLSPWMVGRTGDLPAWIGSTPTSTARSGRLQRERHRLSALRHARRPVRAPPRARRLHVAHVLQHGSRGRPRRLHLNVRRVQRGQPDRQTAENASDDPGGSAFVTLDEDGTACTSDYYCADRPTAADAQRPDSFDGYPSHRAQSRGRCGDPNSLGQGPPRRAATPRSTPRPTRSTATRRPTGERPTTPSRNGFRWIWAAAAALSRVVLKLPPSWGRRTQTLSSSASADGSTFATLSPIARPDLRSAQANHVTVPVSGTPLRRVQRDRQHGMARRATVRIGGLRRRWVNLVTRSRRAARQPHVPVSHLDVGSFAWQASSDNVGRHQLPGATERHGRRDVTGLSVTVSGLNPSTGYTFTVTARDACRQHLVALQRVYRHHGRGAQSPTSARGKPTSESSHTQAYGSGNAVDGDASSYWESANNAFPQWIQVDLGASTTVGRFVLKLPPPSAWATRTQTALGPAGAATGCANLTRRCRQSAVPHLRLPQPGQRPSHDHRHPGQPRG